MNVELSERDKDTTSKKEGRESKNPDRTGSMKVYDGGMQEKEKSWGY
jgi:hypothetical protein